MCDAAGVFASTWQTRAVGVLIGCLLDVVFGDPKRGHPVALFGRAAAKLEQITYRDGRVAGAVHVGLLVGAVGLLGAALQRLPGRSWPVAATATATWAALGGTSLARTGRQISDLLERDDVEAARRLLPSLCGRDPAQLGGPGLTRAALESVAENTADAQVVPLLWAASSGVPAVLGYRAINTLDSMIGYRSPRYLRFGWAAARLDDWANYVGARATAVLVVICAPVVGGSPAVRYGPGGATPPAIPAPTPVSSRRRLLGRLTCGWVGPPGTTMSCRSGPPWATAGRPRWPICAAPWCCRGWSRRGLRYWP
ncbi:cobalamin biosynthesis transmembrane protein CobD [Mycobacterium tuberculosis]|nr:cobalamin biosynthesis transmembrane protein CobD [Mycobacterium tuberculosis]